MTECDLMKPLFRIRPYRPADIEQVILLWHETKKQAFPYVDVMQSYSIEDDRAYFSGVILKESQVWIAEERGIILGFMALEADLVDQLFVINDRQRSGVGSALLNKAREINPEGLSVYTFQKNQSARNFFEKQGFLIKKMGISPSPENEPDLLFRYIRH